MVKVVSKAEAKWRIEQKILLDTATRANCLNVFADAIEAAARFSRGRWAVTVEDDENRIRLHAGHIIVCTLCHFRPHFMKGCVWMALDQVLLQNSPETLAWLNKSEDWKWSPEREKYHVYKDIESRNGYYLPVGEYSDDWKKIQPLHCEAIRLAGTGRKMDPKTPGRHQSRVLEYLREALGRSFPDNR